MPFGKETGKKARNQQIRARQENQNALQRARNHIRHFTHFVIADIGPKFQYNQYQQLTIQQIFITEINNLISIGGETSDYSKYPMIKKFAILIFITSFSAFLLTRRFLPLPSQSTIERWIKKEKQSSEIFNSAKEINEILKNYRTQNKLKDDEIIDSFLSIDAFSVKPSLIITNEGIIRGSVNNEKIGLDDLNLIKTNYIKFEKFAKNQSKYLINDVFVINMQPLNKSLPCQLIHKTAQTNGHANTHIIDELFNVANEVKKK